MAPAIYLARNMSAPSASVAAQQQRYQTLRQDFANIITKISEIESERHEHIIVLETLSQVPGDRRCWRMVGGALIERTAGEVVPEIEDGLRKMDQLIEITANALKQKEDEMKAIENSLGVRGGPDPAKKGSYIPLKE